MNKLYILCGLPFSGKSTLAQKLVKRKNFTRIDIDEILFEMFGNDVNGEAIGKTGWDKVYHEMYKRIDETLKQGRTVVHDAGNFTRSERELAKQIADKQQITSLTIFVDTPRKKCQERLMKNRQTKERFDVTDASFDEAVRELEIPDKDENTLTVRQGAVIDYFLDKHFN